MRIYTDGTMIKTHDMYHKRPLKRAYKSGVGTKFRDKCINGQPYYFAFLCVRERTRACS
jgi:hypothetical protein